MELQSPTRYPLRCKVQLALPNGMVVCGTAADISVGGISVVLDDRIATGLSCPLRFEMTSRGKPWVVTALTTSISGVFASDGGFRVRLAFTYADKQRTALIESLPAGVHC